MIIGIEAERANNPTKTGVEHYAKQLIIHLAKIDRVNKYRLYLRTKPEKWFYELPDNFEIKVIPFLIFWTQLRLSWEMLVCPVDILFIPASALPIFHPKKSVVTIHDLAWLFYPKTFTFLNLNFLRWSTRYAVKKAWQLIAVSQATKNDIVNFYGISSNKTTVVHHGYEETKLNNYRNPNLILPEKFVIFLSTLQPRKNLESLIDAFVSLKKEFPELPHKLLVVGKIGWKAESILKKITENADAICYINYISDIDRLYTIKKADLLVLPSFYEGFGMQILEAFSLEVPVATSNISSMPEVAEDAAIYFDPKNVNEIKDCIKNVLMDKALADSLKVKGMARLKDFSWEKCAYETLKVFTKSE